MASKQLELVNFAKGLAISAIVAFHLIYEHLQVPELIATASKFGGAGIHIFFICSGFGLTLSQLRRPLGWKEFFQKRLRKVYVPYILVVLLSAALPYMYSGSDRLMAVASHVFLFKMFSPAYIISFGAQFWFISTIVQFYLVFLLLEKGRGALGNRNFLVLCCGLSLGWMIFTALLGIHTQRIWGSFFLQYLWEFGLGMCLGSLHHQGKLEGRRISLPVIGVVTLAALALYGLMALKGGALSAFNDLFGAAAMGGICLLLYRIKCLRPVFVWINGFSYELYLVHVLVFATCAQLLSPHLPNPVWCLLALVITFPVALGYSKLLALPRYFQKRP